MNDKQIYCLFGETSNYTDPDAFASDAVLSILDPDDPSKDVDMTVFEQLHILWHIANDPFKNLLDRMNLNQTQCSIRFCIPLRTIQGWACNERQTPAYIRLMMAEATGLLNLRRN